MSKAGKKLIKALEEVKEFIVHPGKQPIHIVDESVIISVEYYDTLKGAAIRDKIANMDDKQLMKLVELQLKAACKIIKTKLPRYIEAKSSAGVTFREGYEDVVSEALVAAKLVKLGND